MEKQYLSLTVPRNPISVAVTNKLLTVSLQKCHTKQSAGLCITVTNVILNATHFHVCQCANLYLILLPALAAALGAADGVVVGEIDVAG